MKILKNVKTFFSHIWIKTHMDFMSTWVAQLGKCLTLAQVMISQFHEFKLCTRLCANSVEPGAHCEFSLSLSLYPSPAPALSLSKK